jgi:hypothetical protein
MRSTPHARPQRTSQQVTTISRGAVPAGHCARKILKRCKAASRPKARALPDTAQFTHSTLRCMLVRIGAETYAIPDDED